MKPRTYARAADILTDWIAKPTFNNGDAMSAEFHNLVQHGTDDKEKLAKFREVIYEMITEEVKIPIPNYDKSVRVHEGPFTYFTTDYDADSYLNHAAEAAGLKSDFPCKSSLFVDDEHVSVKVGYGAPHYYHYPLSGDRWLVTTLHTNGPGVGDLKKIIKLVEDGKLNLELEAV